MTRDKALEFCAALQRLMKRSKISAIEANAEGRIILHDEYGRRCASFDGIDLDDVRDLTAQTGMTSDLPTQGTL